MGYLEITAIVFACISAVFAIFTAHYFFFTVIGIFARKKFKPRDEKLRYGIVIGARNEETVIAALIDSIKSNNYPQDKIEIFVAAHNCTDRTAEIARAHGATVYEYDNLDERTVGYAYKYIFDCIDRDYGTMSFDGFFIINADNVLTPDYISKMNDAFLHYDKKNVITSYRNSGNIGDNYMSCLYGLYFLSACRFEARGRTLCICSTRVSGGGYVMPSEFVKDGGKYVTPPEDWEFTADKIARGHKVMHCDEAEFFDEQPTTVPVMLRQRMRWARGHTLVFFTKYFKLLKSIFTPKRKGGAANKYSAYDISVAIMPLGAIAVFTWLAHLVCIALCPLFGYDPAVVWAWYGIIFAIGFGISYLLSFFSGALLAILERKRIRKVGFFKMTAALLLFPFFLLLNVILDVASLFVKNLAWKAIPHKGQ